MTRHTRESMRLAFVLTVVLVAGLCQICSADNLITNNANFDTLLTTLNLGSGLKTGVNGGWNYECTGNGHYLLSESKGGLPKYIYSGANSLRIGPKAATPSVPGVMKVWQDVMVKANSDYTASVYVRTDNRFGVAGLDQAGLKIQELDSGGSVLVDHDLVGVAISTAAYVPLQLAFHTNSSTETVRFVLYTYSTFPFVDGNGCIKFDEAVLDGPAPTRAVTGQVTSGGVGIDGATVSIPGAPDATTAGGGYYSIDAPISAVPTPIRASKDGYLPQKKWRAVPASPAVTLDFDLDAAGSNLLANPGFDDCSVLTPYTTVPDGWSLQTSGTFQKESYWASVSYPSSYKRGEEAAYLYAADAAKETSLYQIVPAQPNSSYTARVWAFAQYGSSWYSGSDQKAALWVQEIDRTGVVVQEHKEYLTDFANWQQLTHTFTTGATCRAIRIACWANLIDDYNFTLSNVIFDSAELNGAAGDPLPPLSGVVKDRSTGVGIPGAYVELMNTRYNTTTEADGYWQINLPEVATFTLRAGKGDDYYAQRLVRACPSLTPVVFSLEPTGDNLLGDAGFDDYVIGTGSYHWSRIWESSEAYRTTVARVRKETTAGGVPTYFESGEEAIAIYPYNTSGLDGWIYQKMAVLPSTEYTARARFKAGWTAGQTHSWGTDWYQTASLYVNEYDASGAQITTTTVPATFVDVDNWETLTATFTTDSQTAYVEVGGYTYIAEANSATNRVRAIFDTMELNGPAAPYSFGGTVTMSGTPVGGATVVVTDLNSVPTTVYTTNTDSNGNYTVPDAKLGHEYNVRVSGVGFYAMQKGAVVNGVVALDFAVQPLNLLFNAGFDDGVSPAWPYSGTVTSVASETKRGRFNTPALCDTGEDAIAIYSTTANKEGLVYQDVPVVPEQPYTASVKFHAGWLDGVSTAWGADPTQLAKLVIQEYDAAGNAIGAEQSNQAILVDPTGWETLSLSFTTSASTATVRVGGYAFIVDAYNSTLGRAVFDTFSLSGPAPSGPALGELKAKTDGSAAMVTGKVVTATYDGFFYIEEPDRSSGIKVYGSAPVGVAVDVSGTLATVNGERSITGAAVALRSAGVVPAPLGLNNRAPDSGPSPVGLYVTMWGQVDAVDSPAGFFTVTDGSGTSLKVYGTATLDDYVSVKGALGAELSGETVVPVLRAVEVSKKD